MIYVHKCIHGHMIWQFPTFMDVQAPKFIKHRDLRDTSAFMAVEHAIVLGLTDEILPEDLSSGPLEEQKRFDS
jgi:hypothetical protein